MGLGIGCGMQQEAPKEADVQETELPEDSESQIVVSEDQESEAEALLEAQVAEWKELAMRATADLDNFRKRMAREKSEALKYSKQALLEELLPVIDSFEMGLQAAADDQSSMIYQGMQMVKKQLDDFLGCQGVVEIPAEGMTFDHNLHEAAAQEESAEVGEGTILRVIRRGFKLHDRLLRAAHVVVAKIPEEAGEGE